MNFLIALAGWGEPATPKVGVCGAAFKHTAYGAVLAHEHTAVGVGCAVADVDAHAAEAWHIVDERHTAAGERLVWLLTAEAGRVVVQQHFISAAGNGCLALDLALPKIEAVAVFECVADIDAVDVEPTYGVVTLAGDAFQS